MTDTLRKFLEEASKDKEFTERLSKAETPEAVITLAAEKGFTLTEADMESPESEEGEISDDEVEAVAGGAICVCDQNGCGKKGVNDRACFCSDGGHGNGTELGCVVTRCECYGYGVGASRN